MQVQVVIIKLDRRDDAILLERAIAWRRIQVFNCGQYIQGTDADLNDSRPSIPLNAWIIISGSSGLPLPTPSWQPTRPQLLNRSQMQNRELPNIPAASPIWKASAPPPETAQAEAETKHAQEHDRAEFLNQLASWFAGIIIIIIIIIFVVYVWRA